MAEEIERKFLVHTAKLPKLGQGTPYTQGYLARKPAVRVRLAESPRPEAWLTIKGKGDIIRPEFEYSIPVGNAKQLLTMCKFQLTKVRYHVDDGDHVWEIDQFTGAHKGLWLAEIELTREDEKFTRHKWLSTEVTTSPAYSNAALAEAGRSP
jgi:adenylate cyclase